MRTVEFVPEDGMYYAYFKLNGVAVWKYFVPWGDALESVIVDWIEHGVCPYNAKPIQG